MKYKLPKQRGCLKSPKDNRRIMLGDISFTPDPAAPSWEAGFDNEVKYGKLKREHQGSSLSCVGQGWSKYLEMLNLIETKKAIDLSARFIYSQIRLLNGYAFINDGANLCVKQGCSEESVIPSYDAGKPPTEAFMALKGDITDTVRQKALKFQAKKYVWLDTSPTLTTTDWENIRQIIWQFGGFVSGFQGHCMYATSYGKKNNRNFIKFVNSYGQGSDIEYYGDVELYDITFLVDLPNPPDKINMYKLVREPMDPSEVWAINNGAKRHIANWQTLELGKMSKDKLWDFSDVSGIPLATDQEWSLPADPEIHLDPTD